MDRPYDTAITLSYHLRPNGRLTDEGEERVKRSIELYLAGTAMTILMSGGRADRDIPLSHADVMADYAIAQGVERNRIFKDTQALDTVGHAVFTKTNFVVPMNWEKIIVTTHDYHVERVRQIFHFVYGTGFDIRYESIPSGTPGTKDARQRAKNELKSLQAFLDTFAGVESGCDDDIVSRLHEAHPLYKKR